MRATVTAIGAATVVALDGIIDLASIGMLHDQLTRVIRQQPGATVVVDLDAVESLDDTGLGVLLGAAAAARDAGGDLEVVATRPGLLERLDRTRFDRAVTVRATIA